MFYDSVHKEQTQMKCHGIEAPPKNMWTLLHPLRIVVNHKCKLSDRIHEACSKGRKTYFALSDLGTKFLNLKTFSHLYKKIVLPSVLYWFKLLNNMVCSDTAQLNTFQHFICKNSLNLPKSCRSDTCESLFDTLPIVAEIDARKQLFFGRLCRLSPNNLTKFIFLTKTFVLPSRPFR